MIHFRNVSKFYPTRNGRAYIFKNINFKLPMTRSIGVLGPNGAGKSTLVRMIGGADTPSRGHIDSDLRISWPLGLQGGLQGSMSGRENVRFVARINGIRNTSSIECEVAKFADIGRYYDEPIRTYSSGMKSRVAFGLSLAFNFDVLLIDEVTSVGDATFRKKSQQALKRIRETTHVIMVSHEMKQLQEFCEAGIVIKNQNFVFHSCIQNAIRDYQETYVKL
jgi:capsular polysaccharide transport system ATP-binding protein